MNLYLFSTRFVVSLQLIFYDLANMKKFLILSLLCFGVYGCADSTPKVSDQTAANVNATISARQTDETLTVSSHSTDAGKTAPVSSKDASAKNASPMAKSVDVSKMSADIETAKADYEKNPSNAEAKKNLAKAYFERAFALTEAAQYRAALGDFRRGLKLDPNDEQAKKMHDEIINIFKSLNRDPPKEGEEPPPMPIDG